ncbi:MAG: radical SAM protein [Bacteroidia bacterium]
MKIGLIYPNQGRKEKAFHVGLGYIAAYARLHHQDLEFTLLDTRIASKRVTERFFATQFDLVGITLMSGIFKEALALAQRIKARFPETPIVVGGPYVSTLGTEIMDFDAFDLAVVGEGEAAFSEIIGCLKEGTSLEAVDGLIFRDNDGKTRQTPARKGLRNIDELPMPAYDIFDMDAYPIHRVVTSRGCPYKCAFCSSAAVWEFKWKKRNPRNLVDEIEYLVRTYGRKTFFFNDDSFNMSLDRAEEICDELIARGLNILWSTPLRADRINPELAQKMRQAGCYNVGIGIESANNQLLAQMGKQITIEDITQGIRTFQSAGIEVLGQFIIGNPGETKETFEETLAYAQGAGLDFALFYSMVPYRGTQLWEFVEQHGRFLHTVMHEFHEIKPRILFETDAFTAADRAEAISRAQAAGFYVDDNRMSYVFDFGRNAAKHFQAMLPSKMGNWLYLQMKGFYRRRLRGKMIKQ